MRNSLALHGALACSYGSTALRRAAWFGRTACVKLLVEAGADLNMRDVDSKTALFYAESREHAESAELLRAAGATVDGRRPSASQNTELESNVESNESLGYTDLKAEVARLKAELEEQAAENVALRKKEKLYVLCAWGAGVRFCLLVCVLMQWSLS
jgi:ankyrin repeat protein